MVTIAKAHDEQDALDVLRWLRLLVKEAAVGMASGTLAPCLGRVGRPRLLDIYLLLPRTNCRDCGERTCLAFTARLFLGEGHPRQCPPLLRADCVTQLNILEERLGVGLASEG